jgi:alginate O-acetyltransferase complex protein AlgI
MLFSAPVFLFAFLPLTVAVWLFAGRSKLVLLVASLVFYSWGEPVLVLLLIFVIVFNYLAGGMIWRRQGRRRRIAAVIAIAIDLMVLVAFKYAGFIEKNLNVIAGAVNLPRIPVTELPLPLGISFFTFQALAYLIDVDRRLIAPAPSLYRFALFKSFFPQLIAGPIVRYQQVADDFSRDLATEALFADGARRFVFGLAKKVVIADSLAPVVDSIFRVPPEELGLSVAWLGAAAFALQIYFDFSGYSDMAIGLGRLFGIHLPENFVYPYIAISIRDFWRRWHITLSTWFRDYVYVPLGGNRRGAARTYCNLVIVFALCGLWHGARWTFVIWGLYHGAFLVAERTMLGRALGRLPSLLQHAYVLLVVTFGWVIFRSPTLEHALGMIKAMLGANSGAGANYPLPLYLNGFVAIVIALGVASSAPLRDWLRPLPLFQGSGGPQAEIGRSLVAEAALAALLVASLALMATETHLAFIYFRF